MHKEIPIPFSIPPPPPPPPVLLRSRMRRRILLKPWPCTTLYLYAFMVDNNFPRNISLPRAFSILVCQFPEMFWNHSESIPTECSTHVVQAARVGMQYLTIALY